MRHFKKRHRDYPLVAFDAFLRGPAGIRCEGTIERHKSTIRRMLAATGTTMENPGWKDYDKVITHYQTCSREDALRLQAAWTHWLAFAGLDRDLPALGLGKNTNQGPLAEALRLLVRRTSTVQLPQLKDIDLVGLSRLCWFQEKDDDGNITNWKVCEKAREESIWEAVFEPALQIIRRWGYPKSPTEDSCWEGAWFIPSRPKASDPMPTTQIGRLLRDKYDPDTKKWLEAQVRELQVKLNISIMHPDLRRRAQESLSKALEPKVELPAEPEAAEEEKPLPTPAPRMTFKEREAQAMAEARELARRNELETARELIGTGAEPDPTLLRKHPESTALTPADVDMLEKEIQTFYREHPVDNGLGGR